MSKNIYSTINLPSGLSNTLALSPKINYTKLKLNSFIWGSYEKEY